MLCVDTIIFQLASNRLEISSKYRKDNLEKTDEIFSESLIQGTLSAIFWVQLNIERKISENSQLNIYSAGSLKSTINFNFCNYISLMRYRGLSFKTLLRCNSILEHHRRKWTKNKFLVVVSVKYIILNKCWVQRPYETIIFWIQDSSAFFAWIYFVQS